MTANATELVLNMILKYTESLSFLSRNERRLLGDSELLDMVGKRLGRGLTP